MRAVQYKSCCYSTLSTNRAGGDEATSEEQNLGTNRPCWMEDKMQFRGPREHRKTSDFSALSFEGWGDGVQHWEGVVGSLGCDFLSLRCMHHAIAGA